MWVKSKNTTTCMQENASTEYKSATNKQFGKLPGF
jgi:hypothetical protein